MRRLGVLLGGAALLALGLSGAVVQQRRSAAREREQRERLVHSDSTAASLRRAVAAMRPRDSAFAAELAGRALPRGEATTEQMRLQRAVTSLNFASIHDRNAGAIAWVASELDGASVSGTAFGVAAGGLLVANRHVVRSASGGAARRIMVRYAGTSEWLAARVVRESDTVDLALLRLERPGTYPVVAGVSPNPLLARPGSPVTSIGMTVEGTPARTTTTAGMVGRLRPDTLQVHAYAGTGSNGSPVFDARGEVVGVVFSSAPESRGRILYAVPWERLKAFVAETALTPSRR